MEAGGGGVDVTIDCKAASNDCRLACLQEHHRKCQIPSTFKRRSCSQSQPEEVLMLQEHRTRSLLRSCAKPMREGSKLTH